MALEGAAQLQNHRDQLYHCLCALFWPGRSYRPVLAHGTVLLRHFAAGEVPDCAVFYFNTPQPAYPVRDARPAVFKLHALLSHHSHLARLECCSTSARVACVAATPSTTTCSLFLGVAASERYRPVFSSSGRPTGHPRKRKPTHSLHYR